jgi:hypothetical protein
MALRPAAICLGGEPVPLHYVFVGHPVTVRTVPAVEWEARRDLRQVARTRCGYGMEQYIL